MGLLEDKAESIARAAFDAELQFDDATIPDEIGKAIGATSTTLQEAFNTAMRVIRAAKRGEDLLVKIVEARKKGIKVVSTESLLEDDKNIH
jgi:hypothetical protein